MGSYQMGDVAEGAKRLLHIFSRNTARLRDGRLRLKTRDDAEEKGSYIINKKEKKRNRTRELEEDGSGIGKSRSVCAA